MGDQVTSNEGHEGKDNPEEEERHIFHVNDTFFRNSDVCVC